MSSNDTVTGCLFLAEISARHTGEVWCSPTCGSLSGFKCHSNAISAFSCLMRTLAAACDAVQVNARMEVFFRDSGINMLCCKGPFALDVARFIRRWAFRFPMQETRVALQWCVCFTLHGFDFFTSSRQQNQITKRMSLVRIGLWGHSAFAHVRIRRLCDTFGSARQHLHHGAMTGCNNAAAR